MNPVTFQVLQSRLEGIVKEMQENVFRTGYSTVIRESEDVSCAILDRTGSVVCGVYPLHFSCYYQMTQSIFRIYNDNISSGDAFISNHPYFAGITHTPDLAVITPVVVDGELIAFCACMAHKSDLGGMVPGTSTGSSREIFQEGVLYPPIKYMERGEVIPEVDAILRANSRTPYLVLGDIRGQVGTARLGERRIREVVEKYGVESVMQVMEEIQQKTEQRIRLGISKREDGTAAGEAFIENDGIVLERPIRIHVTVRKQGDRITFDFSGSSEQVQGPVNTIPSVVKACCYYVMIALIDPELPSNGGLERCIETVLRKGSVLNPDYPAPTNNYMPAAHAVIEAILQAMSTLVPEKKIAESGGPGSLTIAGKREDGRRFVLYELLGSAYGARLGKDGVSGISVHISNAKIMPIEVLESEYPIRIRRFELIPDSGGAGEYRGGLGFVREYEILAPKAELVNRGGKHKIPARGIQGGKSGRLGNCIVRPDTPQEIKLPGNFTGFALRKGDVVRIEKAGGGGCGRPEDRRFEQIVEDVLNGYVTKEKAFQDYKVVPERLERVLQSRQSLALN